MRYIAGVVAGMRVDCNGRKFTIKEILNEEEPNQKPTLMCAEALTDA